VGKLWSRSGGFVDSSGNGRVVTPLQRDEPMLTPVWRGFQGNLNSQTNKWGPRKGEWPLWGEEEHGYRRNFPDEGKWSGVPVAPTTGQAERPAVRLPHPLPLKGRTGRKPGPTLKHLPKEESNARTPKTKRNPDHPGNPGRERRHLAKGQTGGYEPDRLCEILKGEP
jgi:hypothetical protein